MSGANRKKIKQDEESFWGPEWEDERAADAREEKTFFDLLPIYGRKVWIVETPAYMEAHDDAFASDEDAVPIIQD